MVEKERVWEPLEEKDESMENGEEETNHHGDDERETSDEDTPNADVVENNLDYFEQLIWDFATRWHFYESSALFGHSCAHTHDMQLIQNIAW